MKPLLIFTLLLLFLPSQARVNEVVGRKIRDHHIRHFKGPFDPSLKGLAFLKSNSKSYQGMKQTIASYQQLKPPKEYSQKVSRYFHGLPHKMKKEAENVMRKYGLTKEEVEAIYFYTGNGYKQINRFLRQIKMPADEIKKVTSLIVGGLCKLPDHKGEVLRVTRLPDFIKKDYKKDAIVMDAALMSTSYAKNWENSWGGSEVMKIQSKSCKKLPVSQHEREKEVLCLPGTAMKIKEVSKKGHKTYYTMEEIGPLFDCQKYKSTAGRKDYPVGPDMTRIPPILVGGKKSGHPLSAVP